MRPLSLRLLAGRYSVATTFVLLVLTGEVITVVLTPRQAGVLRQWVSTNVANLHYHPVQALVLSAFLAVRAPIAWLAIIAFAMFGANRALGNLRLVLVCGAGHVIGTAVSEGIVAYRVGHGRLPASYAHLIDIGPSYVVVSAIVVAVLSGSRLVRAGALTALGALIFIGHIFRGLTSLDVAAIGHATAAVTAAVLAFMLRGDSGSRGDVLVARLSDRLGLSALAAGTARHPRPRDNRPAQVPSQRGSAVTS